MIPEVTLFTLYQAISVYCCDTYTFIHEHLVDIRIEPGGEGIPHVVYLI